MSALFVGGRQRRKSRFRTNQASPLLNDQKTLAPLTLATLDHIVAAHTAAGLPQPIEQIGDLGRGDGEAAVGSPVIDAHLTVNSEPATRKHDLVDIAEAFVFCLRLEHPLVGAGQYLG